MFDIAINIMLQSQQDNTTYNRSQLSKRFIHVVKTTHEWNDLTSGGGPLLWSSELTTKCYKVH